MGGVAPAGRRGHAAGAPPPPIPGGVAPPSAAAALYPLKLRALWRSFARQPASFKFVCVYVFFEYVRPQQIYEWLAVLPWGNIAIGAAVLAFFLEGNRIRFEMADWLLLAFTGVLLMSSVTAIRPDLSFDAMKDWLTWVLIYVLIANTVVTEVRFLLFAALYLLWNFKMAQSGVRSWAADGFAFRDWGASGAPGWFSNSGEFGLQMAVYLPLVLAFLGALRSHWSKLTKLIAAAMVFSAVMSIVASSSRGALLALAAMVLWRLPASRYKWRALAGALVLAGFVWVVLPPEQKERFRTVGEDKTSTNRSLYWQRGRAVIAERPVLGIGYKNWADWHAANFGYRALPHNIFIEAGAEMGVTGLLAFVALIGGTLVVNRRTRRIARTRGENGLFLIDTAFALDAAMVGYLAGGFFVTVLYYPYFWINFAMTVALHRSARAAVPTMSVQRTAAA